MGDVAPLTASQRRALAGLKRAGLLDARTPCSLRTTCDDYSTKFGVSAADLYHVLRALTWFEDAEADAALPRRLTTVKWRAIRAWYEKNAAQELLRRMGTR